MGRAQLLQPGWHHGRCETMFTLADIGTEPSTRLPARHANPEDIALEQPQEVEQSHDHIRGATAPRKFRR